MKEVKAYTVAVGNLPMIMTKKSKKAVEIIKNLDGLYGVHPEYPRGTLLLFKTENHAKRAKNELESYGIKTGNNICECYIPEQYAREVKNDE